MKNSRSGLFLIEFLIALLFFFLACAVCIQLFVSSYLLSCSSVNKNHACMWAENVSEIYYASEGNFQSVVKILSDTEQLSSRDLTASAPQQIVSALPSVFSVKDTSLKDNTGSGIPKQSFYLYFDKNWQLIPAQSHFADADFILIFSNRADTDFSNASLSVYTLGKQPGNLLYTLSLKKYHQKVLA